MSFELNYIVWEGKNNSFSPAEKIFDAETLFRKISENEFRSMGFLIVKNKECHIKTKKDGRTRCIYVETNFPKRNGFILFDIRRPKTILSPRQYIESTFTIIYSHGIIETFEYKRNHGEKMMLEWAEKRKDVENCREFFKEVISYNLVFGPIIVSKKIDRAFFHGQEIDFTFFKNFNHELRFNVEENDLHMFRQYNSIGKTLYSENLRGKNIQYLGTDSDVASGKIIIRTISVKLFIMDYERVYIGKNSITEVNDLNIRSVNNNIIFRGKNIIELVKLSDDYRENVEDDLIEIVDRDDVCNYVFKLLVE